NLVRPVRVEVAGLRHPRLGLPSRGVGGAWARDFPPCPTPNLCTPMHGGAGPPAAEGTSRTVCRTRLRETGRSACDPKPVLPVSEVVSGSYFVSSDPAQVADFSQCAQGDSNTRPSDS